MKEIKYIIKRDKYLWLTEFLISFGILLAFITYLRLTTRSARSVVQELAPVICELAIPISVVVCQICMIIRWAVLDNRKQRIFKASLPISKLKDCGTDLFSGCIFMLVSYVLYLNVSVILCNIGSIYCDFITENTLFLIWGIMLQTTLVFSKSVSRGMDGTLISYFVLNVSEFELITCVQFSKFYLLAWFLGAVAVIVLLSGGIYLACKKTDIAKGGVFYFNSVRMVISALIATFILLMILLSGKDAVVTGILRTLLGVVVAWAIFAGTMYYFRAKK